MRSGAYGKSATDATRENALRMTKFPPPLEKQNQEASPVVFRVALALSTVFLIVLGYYGDYHFLPEQNGDGFVYQIDFIQGVVETGQLHELLNDPLYFIHFLRWLVTYPFIALDSLIGSTSSLFLLAVLIAPLLLSFSKTENDWRGRTLLYMRLPIMLMPLAVSGRTSLVAIGMGYIVAGVMRRPFSLSALILGSVLSVLSSASVMLTIAVLVFIGNRNRSRKFFVTKAVLVFCLMAIFIPSVVAKIYGFSTGAPGYLSVEEERLGLVIDKTTAIGRILSRSTLSQSYVDGNFARMGLYLLFVAGVALHFLLVAVRRERHLFSSVFLCLCGGILFEGLGVWLLLFPLIWRYTSRSNDPSTFEMPRLATQ